MSRPVSVLVGLGARIAIASIVCASLGTLVMVRTVSVEQTRTLLERAEASPGFARATSEACRAQSAVALGPAHLAQARVRVFDARGRAHDGGVTPTVVAAVVGGARRRELLSFWGFGGSTLAVRRSASGPCAIASIEVVAASGRRRAGGLMLVLVFAAAATAVALTATFAVRPLSRRLAVLARAAEHVGETTFRRPTDAHRDDLAALAAALVDSHARIVTSREAAATSRAALEEHLREIAHDLRTPVTALALALERAQREPDPNARTHAIADALRDAAYLGALVENLETETRVKGRVLASVEVDLCALVSDAITRARALGAQYGAEVDGAVPDGSVMRRTDPIALTRALSNLAENAVRHGARHVAVILRVEAGEFRIDVRNDGANDASSFQPGRGLAITRAVCEALGFELRFASEGSELLASICEHAPRLPSPPDAAPRAAGSQTGTRA